MKQRLFYVTLGFIFLSFLWGRQALEHTTIAPVAPSLPQRIVSLAPSLTETLYAIGLGPQVVGVTQFCNYPPETASLPRVAGFGDINLELVLRLRPDLVILPIDNVQARQSLELLGVNVLPVNTLSLPQFMQDVAELGQATGHSKEAQGLVATLKQGLDEARARATGQDAPRVLVSVMHSYEGLGYIHQLNAIGSDGFYSELIKAAGGTNIYQGSLPFPRLSREALLFLNPDVIIDILPPYEDIEAVRKDWESLTSISAIKNNRLFLFTEEGDSVPGPRSLSTLTKFSRAFYPETTLASE